MRAPAVVTLALLALLAVGAASSSAWEAGPRLLWETSMPCPPRALVAGESGVVLASSDFGTNLQAYDALTGQRLWRHPTGGGLWSPPTIWGSTVYVVPHDQTLLGLRLSTGDRQWWRGPRFPEAPPPLPGLSEAPPLNHAPPIATQEKIITISLEGVVTILYPAGQVLDMVDLQPGRTDEDLFWATPALLEQTLCAATTRGRFWVVPLDGPQRASSRLLQPARGRRAGSAAREVRAPLLAFKNRVYMSTMDGTVHCLAGGPHVGAPAWRRSLGPPGRYHSTPGGLALAAPQPDPADEGSLYVSLLDQVAKLDASSGEVLWSRSLPNVRSVPAFWGGLVLVGLGYSPPNDGSLVALEGSSGEVRWTVPLPSPPSAGPTVHRDLVFLGFADGRLQGYDLGGNRRPPPPAGGRRPEEPTTTSRKS